MSFYAEFVLQNFVLSVASISPRTYGFVASERVQRLKDISVQKEILKDLTACEFALKLDVKQENSKIDYDMLISNLENDINLLKSQQHNKNPVLLERIVATKNELTKFKSGEITSNLNSIFNSSSLSETMKSQLPIKDKNDTILSVENIKENLKLIVREDGTVDWDEAIASSREVAKFGSELWERINGKEEGLPTWNELFGQLQSKVIETEQINKLSLIVQREQENFNKLLQMRDKLKSDLRDRRRNGEVITINDIEKLQKLEFRFKELDKRVRLFTLNLDIEKICAYLYQEIESSVISSNPFDQRSLVAEIALIDKQLSSILSGLRLDIDGLSSDDKGYIEDSDYSKVTDDVVSLIDDDELNLLYNEVTSSTLNL